MASHPRNPRVQNIVPGDKLEFLWDLPISDGCLPVLSYTLNRDGVDTTTNISPAVTLHTDSGIGATGTEIVYKIKSVNSAGESLYCEELKVIVGVVPNSPTGLLRRKIVSQSEIEVEWVSDVTVADNPETTSFRVYLDDLSGNEAGL